MIDRILWLSAASFATLAILGITETSENLLQATPWLIILVLLEGRGIRPR